MKKLFLLHKFISIHIFIEVLLLPSFFTFCEQTHYSRKNYFKPEENWPKYNNFGQISGVDVDTHDLVYLFHRGDRQWNQFTFSESNIYLGRDRGPIVTDTIIVLDAKTGVMVAKTGSNLFYVPHGLTVDYENNIWVTDVALHQVFKFRALNVKVEEKTVLGEPLLTLGVAFEPGSDEKHFCKPTDIAIDKETRDFYVSDGYCNSRILKYNQNGHLILNFGRTSVGSPESNFYMLNLPHALSLSTYNKILYVADRENFRVVAYDSHSGKFRSKMAEELKSRIFSVASSKINNGSDLIFVLTNSTTFPKTVSVYNADSGKFLLNFFPQNYFTNPHDIAVSQNLEFCYIVELNPCRIWKFNLDFSVVEGHIEDPNHQVSKSGKVMEESKTSIDKKNIDLQRGSSILAIALVALVFIFIFVLFIFHIYRRKGSIEYDSRRLMRDDDDDDDMGGISLT